MNIIVDMWQFAESAAHQSQCQEFEPIKSALKFNQLDTEESYCFIATYSDRSIISFRGTKNNIKSWILNFSAFPLKKDELVALFKENLVHTQSKEKGIIHNGFYKIWEQFKSFIDNYIKNLPEDHKIIVTGMSQGGAIATICARHLVKNRNLQCDLVTFGAPAQGTLEYAMQIDTLITTNYRVVNGYDIVPTLPPSEAGFVHTGLELQLFEPWWHKYFRRIHDHYYSFYTKSLLERFKKPDDQEALKEVLKRVYI